MCFSSSSSSSSSLSLSLSLFGACLSDSWPSTRAPRIRRSLMGSMLSCAAVFYLMFAGAARAGELQVQVSVPAGRSGVVMAAVFDQAQGFPRGAALRTGVAQPIQGKAVFQFPDLPTGNYAVTAFLDENGNSKLDANVFNLPTEPYGFSRNARGFAGPPEFAEAAFRLEEGSPQQTFELK